MAKKKEVHKSAEQLLEEDLEKRFQIGQAFMRIALSPDWVDTVDALLCEMQTQIDEALSSQMILSYPIDNVRDTVLLAHGKQEFINQFRERMEMWLRDGQVNENQQSVILETKNDIGM